MDERIVIRAGTFRAEITIPGFVSLPSRNFRKLTTLLRKHRYENENSVRHILNFLQAMIDSPDHKTDRKKFLKRFEFLKKELF